MQANKIWKSLLVLLISVLIPVLIGLSWYACRIAESEGWGAVFLGAIVVGFVAFLYSLPVILMIATIYRLFKGFN
jgi:hypothetical protein